VKVWIDAQLTPSLATWMRTSLRIEATALSELGLRDAGDLEIFRAARDAGAVILTKDSDFVDLVLRHGAPPGIVWVTLGNTSNRILQEHLGSSWPRIARLILDGEPLVEVTD
jgi:predicted nuclease of predicted toxin-antitoxin system